MIYILIAWYLVGVIGTAYFGYQLKREFLMKDLLISLTAGGICGLLSAFIGLYYVLKRNKFWDRRIF